jgi:hypothetical protein
MTLKAVITLAALALVLLHYAFPGVSVDSLTLILLVVAILPWVMPLVKSVELPGGFKIELQEVKEATAKVVTGSANVVLSPLQLSATGTVRSPNDPVIEHLKEVLETDNSLALVGAGIEIEKRLRELAEQRGLPTEGRSLGELLRDLEKSQILPQEALAGLRDIAALRNRAAHGAPVSSDAAAWVLNMLPSIFASIDRISHDRQ